MNKTIPFFSIMILAVSLLTGAAVPPESELRPAPLIMQARAAGLTAIVEYLGAGHWYGGVRDADALSPSFFHTLKNRGGP